ncbi:Flp1 family type IVb pilin [Anaerotalea alkaliphila]|uniref:HTH merR-type domain-containing protein n=1 Tax=Anaerotalea alkaliphila TaxID=2662126 RepID=A0A7X5HU37_9FIRM|nr:Flp1 family type IVb pilin [Anaerotalea alkaliphila]NDL66695.1 hypothetical protein [Anaerotalea alkaliphila]
MRLIKCLRNEEGMGVIEIALIIVVLIGLAFLFKEHINQLLASILGQMRVDQFNF